MEYGKRITKESFHQNRRTTKEITYQIPIIIKDKASALSEVMRSLELISDKKTMNLIITIEADHSFKFKKLTKEYEVNE